MFIFGSVYRVGTARVVARSVYTNTAPTGAFRGVSGTYLVFALERHMDHIANELGEDRREYRLRSLMDDGDEMLNGQVLDDASILRTAFDELEDRAPWAELGNGKHRGVGMAAAVWLTNPSPAQATVKLNEDGTLGVVTAATDNGSGAVTMGVRQIAAEGLGLPADHVIVTMPDTDTAGYDAGSQGSRTTHVVGRAVFDATAEVKQHVLKVAATMLEAAVEDLVVEHGTVHVAGDATSGVTLAEVATTATFTDGPIAATGSYKTPAPAFNPTCATGMLFPIWPTPTYHLHIAEVEIDPVTGRVTVLRYLVAQEVGKAINPDGVIGQIQGAVTQGLGYALWERLDIEGGRYVQRSLETYGLPLAVDVPDEPTAAGGPSQAEVADLAEFCRQNIVAHLQGATPSSYMPGGYDGNVHGLLLTLDISPPPTSETGTVETPVVEECGSLSIKPGMPLQSSLFNLMRAMGESLRRRREPLDVVGAAKVGLSVLFDPAMHGPAISSGGGHVVVEGVDLEGIDPRRRAVVVLQQAGWTWAFESELSIDQVLDKALADAHLSKGAAANVLSMEIVSTYPRASTGNVPDPQSARPPAVAGQFYPATPAELNAAVDALIADAGQHAREDWAGAMLPHAGWVYSGKLAADVLGRVELPENVIIFAPKHRPGGARWAVSPSTSWLLPGMRVEGDAELAKKLADGVDAFELDATAHRQEHSVEVQLPIIARMSPSTKVTAVVMHGGDWAELSACAEQLAAVIKDLPSRPLLLISSDMNHYAPDDETRRLDHLALAEIEARNPQALLEVVLENHISMCGVVPAVLVMETLRRLGHLQRSQLVGHTTSAEVSGDKSKVVGYAGVLFG